MTDRKMRAGFVLIAAVVMVLVFAVLPQNQSYAGLSMSSYTFTDNDSLWVKADYGDTITSVVPSAGDPDAAYYAAREEYEDELGRMCWYFKIVPQRVGSCTFTAYDGSTAIGSITVKVTQAAVNDMFYWDNIVFYTFDYGHPYLEFGYDGSGWIGSEYDLMIGGDSYKGTMDDDNHPGRITLNRVYPLGTTVTGTLSNTLEPKRSAHYELADDGEDVIECTTKVFFRATAKGKNKKYVKIYAYDVHKGDVIKVSYAGKTYTKKVKKNYNFKDMVYTIKMKKAMKNYKWIKFQATNKFKQTLLKTRTKMRKWDTDKWYPED